MRRWVMTLGAAGVLTGAGARPVTESCPTFALVRSRLAARVRLMRANALTIQKMAFGFFGFLAKFSNFSFLACSWAVSYLEELLLSIIDYYFETDSGDNLPIDGCGVILGVL